MHPQIPVALKMDNWNVNLLPMTKQTPVAEIIYKEGYLITCCLDRLLPDELLVNFIYSVNYAALRYDLSYAHKMGAAGIFNTYIKTAKEQCVIDMRRNHMHQKCVKVVDTITRNPDLDDKEKIARFDAAVIQLWQMIKKRKNLQRFVVLPDHRKIMLPREFMVVCFMYGVETNELLQYFIDGTSIVRDLANLHFCPKYNPCMVFVSAALDTYAPNNEPLIVVEHRAYLQKMLLLNDEMKEEPDYQKRYRKFEKLARQWYKTLKKIPLQRGELSKYISQPL